MEKISHIVGGSPRVGATDNMNAPAVRPGAPSYGRPIGISPEGEHAEISTAQRAVAIQGDMLDQKKMRADGKASTDMSAQFFGRTEEMAKMKAASGKESVEDIPHEPVIRATSGQHEAYANGDEPDLHAPPPSKFTPRGSYLDLHA